MNRPNSINQKFSNINRCDICFASYNRSTRQPVIICSMHHTICRQCMASLEVNPNCPFCREHIRFDKVVLNNYINELLPNEPSLPDKRQHQPSLPNMRQELPAQANRFVADQPSRSLPANQNYQHPGIIRESSAPNLNNQMNYNNSGVPVQNPTSINNQPLQRVYQGQPQNEVAEWDNAADQDKAVYCCLLALQTPFTFFNLLFALSSPQSECMDKPHRSGILVVRPWLLSMGIIESTLMLSFLLVYTLHRNRCLRNQAFSFAKMVIEILFALKAAIWMFAELELFEAGISRYCSGGVYAYGLVLTIIHGIILLFICIVANVKR